MWEWSSQAWWEEFYSKQRKPYVYEKWSENQRTSGMLRKQEDFQTAYHPTKISIRKWNNNIIWNDNVMSKTAE